MRVALSRRLTLEEPARVPDGSGGYAIAWTARGTIWAEIGAERVRFDRVPGGAQIVTPLRITVRAARPGSPSRPRAGQRFREGARLYPILAVHEADSSGLFLTCTAEEEGAP